MLHSDLVWALPDLPSNDPSSQNFPEYQEQNEAAAQNAIDNQNALNDLLALQGSQQPTSEQEAAAQHEARHPVPAPASTVVSQSQIGTPQTGSTPIPANMLEPAGNLGWNIDPVAGAIDTHEPYQPIEYQVVMDQAGDLVIHLDSRHIGVEEVPGGVSTFVLNFYDGGRLIWAYEVPAFRDYRSSGPLVLRNLSAGTHRIGIAFGNKMYKPGVWDTHPQITNLTFARSSSTPPKPPVVQIPSIPSVTGQKDLTVSYSVNGAAKTKTFVLSEGINDLQIDEAYGGAAILRSAFRVVLDTQAPVIATSELPTTTESTAFPITWTSDGGEPRTDTFTLVEGLNTITLKAVDAAGNASEKIIQIRRTLPIEPVALHSAQSALPAPAAASITQTQIGTPQIGQTTLPVDIYRPKSNVDWRLNEAEKTIDIHQDWSPLEYEIDLPQAGDLIISFDMRHIGLEEVPGGVNEFYIQVGNRTQYKGTIVMPLVNNGRDPSHIEYKLSNLAAGPQIIRLTWINKMYKPGHWDIHPELKNLTFSQPTSGAQAAPVVQIPTIPSVTNQKDLTVAYTVNGTPKTKTFVLSEGVNDLQIDEVYGSSAILRSSFKVMLDTKAPVIALSAEWPATTEAVVWPITWTADNGEPRTDTFTLAEGRNSITLRAVDAAGNASEKTIEIRRTLPTEPIAPHAIQDTQSAPAFPGVTQTQIGTPQLGQITLPVDIYHPKRSANWNIDEAAGTLDIHTDWSSLEYELTSQAGDLFISFDLRHIGIEEITGGLQSFDFLIYDNGQFAGLHYGMLKNEGRDWSKVTFKLPNLAAGNHVIKMTWLGKMHKPGHWDTHPQLKNLAFSQTATELQPVPTVVLGAIPSVTNQKDFTVTYTVNGTPKTKTFVLSEGANDLQIDEVYGGSAVLRSAFRVLLDTQPPAIVLPTLPTTTESASFPITWSVDGRERTDSFTLAEGRNAITLKATDAAGNSSEKTIQIRRTIPAETVMVVPNPPASVTSDSSVTIQYTLNGEARSKTFALKAGENVLTLADADASGRQTSQSFWVTRLQEAPAGSEGFTLKTQTNDLLLYQAGELEKVTTADGHTLEHLRFSEDGRILDAQIRYSDGTIELLENGAAVGLLRPDGAKYIYRAGLLAKIIAPDGSETIATHADQQITLESATVRAVYTSAGVIVRLEGKTSGTVTTFEQGVLRSVQRTVPAVAEYVYQTAAGPSPDQILLTAPASDTEEARAVLPFQEAVYQTDGTPIRITGFDGSILRFEGGRLSESVDADGHPVQFTADQSPLGHLVGVNLIQGSLRSTYSADGSLRSVDTGELKIHYRDSQIDFIETDDGLLLQNPVFDDEGVLRDVQIVDADGGIRIYRDGRLTVYLAPDGSRYQFGANGRMTSLETGQKITYALAYDETAQSYTAVIDPNFVATQSTTVRMEYDSELNLKSYVRKNGEITRLLDYRQPDGTVVPRIDEIQSGDSVRRFVYETGADGKQITKVIDGLTVTLYDESGQPLESTILPSSADGATIRTVYRYGKIREVFKNGIQTLLYSYSYDTAGAETTHIRDLAAGTVKEYRDGLLQTSTEEATSVVSTYSYMADQRVREVVLSRLNREIARYAYTYENATTRITDHQGSVRIFDAQDKLIAIQAGGDRREFEYILKSDLDLPDTLEVHALLNPEAALLKNVSIPGFAWTPIQKNSAGLPSEFKRGSYRRTVIYDAQGRIAEETLWQETILASDPTGSNPVLEKLRQMIHAYGNDGTIESTRIIDIAGWPPGREVVPGDGIVRAYQKSSDGGLTGFTESALGQTIRTVVFEFRTITREQLVSRRLEDGSVVYFENDAPTRIENRPDGVIITGIELDADRAVKKAIMTFPDGVKRVFEYGQLTEEQYQDGVRMVYDNGVLARIVNADGSVSDVHYSVNAKGAMDRMWVKDADVELEYDLSGRLTGMRSADGQYYSYSSIEGQDGKTIHRMSRNGLDYEMLEENGAIRLHVRQIVRTDVNGAPLAILPLQHENPEWYFGDGRDGSVEITSDQELTRDMYFDDLTIRPDAKLITNGHRIYVRGVLRNEGVISADGLGASGGASGFASSPPQAGASVGPGLGGAAGAGGGGGQMAQPGGRSGTVNYVGGSGATGGAATLLSTGFDPETVIGSNLHLSGGAGGGGGGRGVYGGWGGKGGDGGGAVVIFAAKIANSEGKITANGQKGVDSNYDSGENGGGGGGGGGGVIYLVSSSDVDGTLQVDGGKGGLGWNVNFYLHYGGYSEGGSPGSAGTVVTHRLDSLDANFSTAKLHAPHWDRLQSTVNESQNILQYSLGYLRSETGAAIDKKYDYLYSADGTLNQILVNENTYQLVYDSQGSLNGIRLNAIPDSENIPTVRSYEGGINQSWSTDGDTQTAQSGGLGTISAQYVFSVPQTVTKLNYKADVFASSNGWTNNGATATLYVEYLDSSSGEWRLIDPTFQKSEHNNGGGGGATGNVSTQGMLSMSVNLTGVLGLRLSARAAAYSNNGGGPISGYAKIYEFGYGLEEQNYLSLERLESGYGFKNSGTTLLYDSSGALQTVQSDLTDLWGAPEALSGRIGGLLQLPMKKIVPVLPGWANSWIGIFDGVVSAADTVMSREYTADGRLETQTTADRNVTVYNDAGKPEAVLNTKGETVIAYSYDADGNLEQVYLKEARAQLPTQIAKAEAAIQSDRVEALRKLSESKALAIDRIKQQAESARSQAYAYLANLESGMNSLTSSKVQGKQGKKAKSAAMDQYRDAIHQVQSQINTINRLEAEAYEGLDTEVQTVSQSILKSAGKAVEDLGEQEKELKKEIIRQEITPVAFDVYRRTLGRDPSTAEYRDLIDRIDYSTGRIILESITQQVEEKQPAVAFDGNGDYLTITDPYNHLSIDGQSNFRIDMSVKLLDPHKNQTLLDIGGWQQGLRINYQGTQKRLEWHIQGSEYGVWSFSADPATAYEISLRRESGWLRMYVNGTLIHEVQNSGTILSANGVRFGRELNDQGDLNGLLGALSIDVAGAQVLRIDPRKGDEFVQDATGKSTVFTRDGAGLNVVAGWLSRSVAEKKIVSTGNLAAVLAGELLATVEHHERTVFVNDVKADVVQELREYLAMDSAARIAYASTLGLSPSDLIAIGSGDAESMISWIEGGSLHFGQSAFNALELLLEQERKTADKLTLAKQSILIDILTGVISPLDEGDLILSMFALKKALALSDMRSEAMKIGWSDLKKIYTDTGVLTEKVVTETFAPGSSINLGNGQGFLTVPDPTADMDFGKGDFTIESWFNFSGTGNETNTIASKNSNPSGWILYATNHQLALYYNWNSAPLMAHIDIAPGQWHHVAVAREGDTVRFFLDGNLVASHSAQGLLFGGGVEPLLVGAYNSGSSGRFYGRLEDLRISRKAVYSKAFVPTGLRLEADASTVALIRESGSGAEASFKDFSFRNHVVQLNGQALIDTTNRRTSTLHRTEETVLRRGPPGTDLSSLTAEEKAAIIRDPANYNPRLIAHISGNHYVVVINVTDTLVTYIDTSIGKDGDNEVVTVAKEEFLKVWEGHVFSSEAIAQKVVADSPQTARIMTDREAQNVRGAFFGNLLGILGSIFYVLPGTQILGFILTAMSAAVSAIQGDWMSAISSLVTIGFGGTGGLFKGLDQVFQGVQGALVSIGTFIGDTLSAIAAPVTGFFNSITSGLKSVIGSIQGITSETMTKIAHTAIASGISYGVSKGLDALGVAPEISSLLGSFASGAFLGSVADVKPGKTQLDMVKSNVFQINSMHHGFELGVDLGLTPDIAQVLSLGLGAITGDLSNVGNAPGDLAKAFKNVLPNVTSALVNVGINTIGTKMGLAPTLTQLISSPLSSIASFAGTESAGSDAFIRMIQDSVLKSGTSLLLDYAAEKNGWDPLLTGLVSNAATGALLGLFNGEGAFKGSIDSYVRSTGSLLSLDGGYLDPYSPSYQYEKARYLLRVKNFSDSVRDNGFSQTLETHAAQIFQRDAIENLFRDGGALDFITQRAEPYEFDGRNTIRLQGSATEAVYLDPASYDMLGRTYQNPGTGAVTTERGSYAFDETGKLSMRSGSISTNANGQVLYLEIENFELQYSSFSQGSRILQDARAAEGYPLILQHNANGSFDVISGIIYDYETHTREVYSDGVLIGSSRSSTATFETLSGETVSGVNSVTREYKNGVEEGVRLTIAPVIAEEAKSGNVEAVKSFVSEIAPQVFTTDNPEESSWLTELNRNRNEFVGGLEDQANAVFDALKSEPQFNNWLLDLPTHYGNLSIEVARMVVVGTLDALNFGNLLPEIWDDSKNAWRSAQEGNLSSAAKSILSVGKNTFIEAMRAMTLLPLVGGGIKLIGKGSTMLLENSLTYADDVAFRMRGLLGKTDEAAALERNRLFQDGTNRALFYGSFKNLDEAADLLQKGHITADDLNQIANNLAQKGEDVLSQLKELFSSKKITPEELRKVRIVRDPVKVNQEFIAKNPARNQAPWDTSIRVDEFITSTKEEYIRFFTPVKDSAGNVRVNPLDNKSVNVASDFLVKKSDLIKASGKTHLTPEEIKDLLALPDEARTHFTIVEVPAGVKMRTGTSGKIEAWGNGGSQQYQLADDFERGWYGKEIEIIGTFNAND